MYDSVIKFGNITIRINDLCDVLPINEGYIVSIPNIKFV